MATQEETNGEVVEGQRFLRKSHTSNFSVELEEDDDEEEDEKSEDGDATALEAMSEEEKQEAMNQFARRRATALDATTPEDSEAKVVSDALAKGAPQAFLKASEQTKLPERSGQVKRISSSWLTSWQWRWLVLKDRRLAWFDGPSMNKLHGVLDFDLLEVEVECLWDQGPGREVVRRGKERGCRSVCVSGFFSKPGEVAFRLLVAGSNRAFEMCVSSRELGDEWIEDILLHLEDAAKKCKPGRPRLNASQLNTFNYGGYRSAWWKVSRISPQTFAEIADSGDILLFKSEGAFPRLIRAASRAAAMNGRYDHVGLILKLEGGELALLEATGNEGVGLCTWSKFMRNNWQTLYPELALRRVRCHRSAEMMRNLQDWVGSVIGKPYNISVTKLQNRGSTGGNQQDFFCSQLVAEALKVMGVLPRGHIDSAAFWPDSFSAKSAPLECCENCTLDPEDLTLDFDLGKGSNGKRAAAAQRDVTISLW